MPSKGWKQGEVFHHTTPKYPQLMDDDGDGIPKYTHHDLLDTHHRSCPGALVVAFVDLGLAAFVVFVAFVAFVAFIASVDLGLEAFVAFADLGLIVGIEGYLRIEL
jgi:hypothetical protein